MEIDLSELDGKSFECIDGCGLCCLCQPEVSESELRLIGADPRRAAGLTNERIDGARTPQPSAVMLQGGQGACHFLRSRRCQIYEIRPRFCRQFPVHVHVSWRVQANANFSCRGITPGGNSLRTFGEGVLRHLPEGTLASELDSSRRRLRDFERDARGARVWQDWRRISQAGSIMASLLSTAGGVGKLMAFADEEPEISDMPIQKLATVLETTEEPEDLDDVALEGNCDALDIERIAWLPVYSAPDYSWNLMQYKDGKLLWMRLEEDGRIETLRSLAPREVHLLERDAEALAVFGSYARTLASRDHFACYAAQVCADNDFADDLMTVYAGVLGTAMLDLWWRASLIGTVTGKTRIDAALAREGVIAYDMDCLDAPTIGAFI
jgi:Fe-S-cluster containining protein